MTIDYSNLTDKFIRNNPKDELDEAIAEDHAYQIVKRFVQGFDDEQPFKKRVFQKLAKHVLLVLDQEQGKDPDLIPDRNPREDSLV